MSREKLEKVKIADVRTTKLLSFIKSYINEHGFPPNVREMGNALGLSSTSTVVYYLSMLEKKGLIKRNSRKNRAIELTNSPSYETNSSPIMCNMPLLGKIAGGGPILAEENIEEVFSVSQNLFGVRGEIFCLTVQGNSMIDAGIADGDTIVAKVQNIANNGDIIVAKTEQGTTVKKFYKENGIIRLQPQNSSFLPIILNNIEILGKVVAVIKRF